MWFNVLSYFKDIPEFISCDFSDIFSEMHLEEGITNNYNLFSNDNFSYFNELMYLFGFYDYFENKYIGDIKNVYYDFYSFDEKTNTDVFNTVIKYNKNILYNNKSSDKKIDLNAVLKNSINTINSLTNNINSYQVVEKNINASNILKNSENVINSLINVINSYQAGDKKINASNILKNNENTINSYINDIDKYKFTENEIKVINSFMNKICDDKKEVNNITDDTINIKSVFSDFNIDNIYQENIKNNLKHEGVDEKLSVINNLMGFVNTYDYFNSVNQTSMEDKTYNNNFTFDLIDKVNEFYILYKNAENFMDYVKADYYSFTKNKNDLRAFKNELNSNTTENIAQINSLSSSILYDDNTVMSYITQYEMKTSDFNGFNNNEFNEYMNLSKSYSRVNAKFDTENNTEQNNFMILKEDFFNNYDYQDVNSYFDFHMLNDSVQEIDIYELMNKFDIENEYNKHKLDLITNNIKNSESTYKYSINTETVSGDITKTLKEMLCSENN